MLFNWQYYNVTLTSEMCMYRGIYIISQNLPKYLIYDILLVSKQIVYRGCHKKTGKEMLLVLNDYNGYLLLYLRSIWFNLHTEADIYIWFIWPTSYHSISQK
jgi:hypothetical protein